MDIVLSRRAKLMMRYAVMTRPNKEVQGFGKVIKRDDDLFVTDIIIPPHEAAGSSVDLPPELLQNFWVSLAENRGETAAMWPLWWHSHANMSVNPSSQDLLTLRSLCQELNGVAFGIVTNTSEEYHGWYSLNTMTEFGQFVSSGLLNVFVTEDKDKRIEKEIAAMMEHVTEKQWNTAKPAGGPGGGTIMVRSGVVQEGYGNLFGDYWERYYGLPISDDETLVPAGSATTVAEGHSMIDELYYMAQKEYPDGSVQAKMSRSEFKDWFDAQTED